MSDNESDNEGPQYEVQFEEDEKKDKYLRKDGKAVAKFANDDKYEGSYLNGKRHGFGVYTFANGARYEGEYVDGHREGTGSFLTLDGGRYTGGWHLDKREGHGTYAYSNGDVYAGGWKNGKKHGQGTYTYASVNKDHLGVSYAAGSSVTGEWSNGQLMYGTWNVHDGSKYVGKFQKNLPDGGGLHVFTNGNKVAGVYEKSQWKSKVDDKVAPHVDPPEPVQPDPLTVATRIINKSVLKSDHFEGIYRLKKEFEGVPNYRKIPDMPIYGCGQPTLEGFKLMFEAISEQDGIDRFVWVNLRNEPILYVNTNSYAPRLRHNINENIELSNLEQKDLDQIEIRLGDKIKKDVNNRGNLYYYFKDTYAENPADRKNLELSEEITGELNESVKTLTQVYEYMNEENFDVQYSRLPIVDEKSPSIANFDHLINILKGVEAGTGIVFNCQMGKGRTTTGTVVAYLVRRALDMLSNQEEESGKEGAAKTDFEVEVPEYDESDPNFKLGQYSMIMKLVKALPNGETVKAEVDDAIDKCKAMQSLRECIHYCKEMYDKESVDRRSFWKRMAVNFIERYFMLICFHCYVKHHAESEFETPFSTWCQQNAALLELLGTRDNGPLASFEWQ